MQPPLTAPFRIGDVEISNRVLLAPLAGIGNWFVRLQARRHGAGLAVSEMVSSFGLHHRNERTLRELLRIDPAEHPVSIQLFGADVEVMRSAAATAAEAARRAYAESGADAVMIARGALGNPWIFEELTGRRVRPPTPDEVARELEWTITRAQEHLGSERAARYLRKFYPWY